MAAFPFGVVPVQLGTVVDVLRAWDVVAEVLGAIRRFVSRSLRRKPPTAGWQVRRNLMSPRAVTFARNWVARTKAEGARLREIAVEALLDPTLCTIKLDLVEDVLVVAAELDAATKTIEALLATRSQASNEKSVPSWDPIFIARNVD